MKTTHKVIKYCAIAFALLLIVSIALGALRIIGTLISFGNDDSDSKLEDYKVLDIGNVDSIKSLYIDVGAANLNISTGESFSVKTNNKNIDCDNSSGTLKIKEKSQGIVSLGYTNDGTDVNITLPADFEFSSVEISAGAGKINVEKLLVQELDIDMGAGRFTFDELYVTKLADIDGGAGDFSVTSGKVNDLNFDMGVGDTDLTLELTGDCELNMGVGDLDLVLLGGMDKYRIDIDKGIGSAKVDGLSLNDGNSFGNGSNRIDIEGGVGSINVVFK